MADDWFGHYDPFTGDRSGDKDAWLRMDYLLMSALQIIEDSTDEYGLLVWEREDEAVEIDAEKRVHKFKAAIDRATAGTEKKPYKGVPGEYFVPRMISRRSDDSIQTRKEWIEKMIEEESEDA